MVTKKRLDFWFWVKLLVIGFMLVFLIYPFCYPDHPELFLSENGAVFPGKLYPFLYEKILLLCFGTKPVRILRDHLHRPVGWRAYGLRDVPL